MEALLEACVVTSNGLLFVRHLGFYHELENRNLVLSVSGSNIVKCMKRSKSEVFFFFFGGGGGGGGGGRG